MRCAGSIDSHRGPDQDLSIGGPRNRRLVPEKLFSGHFTRGASLQNPLAVLILGPTQRPLRLEAAILSRTRSPMTSRSNWAKESSTLRGSRPSLGGVLKEGGSGKTD